MYGDGEDEDNGEGDGEKVYDEPDQEWVEKHEKLKEREDILWKKARVFDIVDGCLMPGIYQINFTIKLPENLFSSIFILDTNAKEKPKAKVKYFVKAYL